MDYQVLRITERLHHNRQGGETKQKKDIRKGFDDALMPLIKEGIITSREELIYQLNEWGLD